jgi:Domain of Unknown Function (DUF1080)
MDLAVFTLPHRYITDTSRRKGTCTMRKKRFVNLAVVFTTFFMLFSFWYLVSPANAANSKGLATASTNPYSDSNLVSMFDGKTLNGWTSSDPKGWVIKNGAMHSTGDARGWIYYNKQQAGTFRWIFDVRQQAIVGAAHHPTVLIWGTINPIRDALSAIQFQPPWQYGWDYRPGENNDGNGKFKTIANLNISITNWSQCEIVADQTTGVAKMACCPLKTGATSCKATEIVVFTDKTAGRVGPLALQVHNKGIQDEFKGLYLESPVKTKPNQFITT